MFLILVFYSRKFAWEVLTSETPQPPLPTPPGWDRPLLPKEFIDWANGLHIKDGRYVYLSKADIAIANHERVYIPESLLHQLVHSVHHSPLTPHIRKRKMWIRLRRIYVHPSLRKVIDAIDGACTWCQQRNAHRHTKLGKTRSFPLGQFMDTVSIDFLGDFIESHNGNKAILLLKERSTGYILLFAIKDKSAASAARPLLRVFFRLGLCRRIVGDHDTAFMADLIDRVRRSLGIDMFIAAPENHVTIGGNEAMNSTIYDLITHFTKDPRAWDSVPMYLAEAAVNFAPSTTRGGFAPAELVYGRQLIAPEEGIVPLGGDAGRPPDTTVAELLEGMEELRDRAKDAFAKTVDSYPVHTGHNFKPKDRVWLTFEKGQGKKSDVFSKTHATRSSGRWIIDSVDPATGNADIHHEHNSKSTKRVHQRRLVPYVSPPAWLLQLKGAEKLPASETPSQEPGPAPDPTPSCDPLFTKRDLRTASSRQLRAWCKAKQVRLSKYTIHSMYSALWQYATDADSADPEYFVEKILTHNLTKDNSFRAKVRWSGFTPRWDTWEPPTSFVDSDDTCFPDYLTQYAHNLPSEKSTELLRRMDLFLSRKASPRGNLQGGGG